MTLYDVEVEVKLQGELIKAKIDDLEDEIRMIMEIQKLQSALLKSLSEAILKTIK